MQQHSLSPNDESTRPQCCWGAADPLRQIDDPKAESITCFNDRELATVLHALRRLQKTGCVESRCDHFDEAAQLPDEEIDVLCERLNLAPAPESVSGDVLWCDHCQTRHPATEDHTPRRYVYDCDCGHSWEETFCCLEDAECSYCGESCEANGVLQDNADPL